MSHFLDCLQYFGKAHPAFAGGLHERPLASRYGWHVVGIDERVEGRLLPFEQVAERVRHTCASRPRAARRATTC